ncbi:hypothetical protein CYLTODRAFT_423927 [Cylindrobasidium torrendii FP15055 ss-10]|uniref:Uncharacterized protein n=1 Tax=Cylindrobasidium torrendii FP15055 ss-10 TaxID=1314674 RepID=A0A0D7B6P6_9AGAR|nr:hypothetical protein CYLTODRAFT_423927 [Cylindrobasidium torrendii FP15055 ss-10]
MQIQTYLFAFVTLFVSLALGAAIPPSDRAVNNAVWKERGVSAPVWKERGVTPPTWRERDADVHNPDWKRGPPHGAPTWREEEAREAQPGNNRQPVW